DMDNNSSAGIRLNIWKTSFNQFLDNPVVGDKIEVNGIPSYPHNMFLEVWQTLGVLGSIPFFILIGNALKISMKIFREDRIYSWLPIIFIQSFIQHLFSNSVYMGAWFWASMALLFS